MGGAAKPAGAGDLPGWPPPPLPFLMVPLFHGTFGICQPGVDAFQGAFMDSVPQTPFAAFVCHHGIFCLRVCCIEQEGN